MVITIWDSAHSPVSAENELLYTWNGYAEYDNIRSIFGYVEANDDRIRSNYLAWIYDLGEFSIKGKKIAEHFVFEDGFSYWWMTLFVEKSPWTQPAIIDAIRIFALNEIISKENPECVKLATANYELHLVIEGLCEKKQISYEWVKETTSEKKNNRLAKVYSRLPLFIQSFLTIGRYIFLRWPLRKIGKIKWTGNEESIFFCSYFFNLEAKQTSQGHFYSKQWGSLPALAQNLDLQQNWLQIYYAHDDIPDAKKAVKFAKDFSKDSSINGVHAFVDSFLSVKIFVNVITNYCKLWLRTKRIGNIEMAFTPQGADFSLWPIMKKDWARTLIGPLAIHNLFYVSLFDKALQSAPHQKKGLYLFENLSWESAFIHMWRKHGHGKLIAVAHATVRYWDTRYFFDPRAILSKNVIKLPQADLVALNGKLSIDNFTRLGYPKERIVECEALRYLHFNNNLISSNKEKRQGGPLRILILGDYMPSGTINMLRLLQDAFHSKIDNVEFTIKPHPNYSIQTKDYLSLNLSILTDQLQKILHKYDIALSSNMTSASVDACLAGLPVIIVLEESELNFSPLRGNSNVVFVSNASELKKAIRRSGSSVSSGGIDELFFLDHNLPRWKKIISS